MGDPIRERHVRRPGEWVTHSTIREVYSSWWLTLRIDDVEKPDGSRTRHEVVRGPDAAGVVVLHECRGVLMIWRHRFMPDTWGWEVPGGAIEPGEHAEEAARRECLEETGWRARGPMVHLSTHHPSVGLVDQTFHLFLAGDAECEGEPSDRNEAARVAWRPLDQVAADLRSGRVSDAFSQLGVVLAMTVTGHGDLLTRHGSNEHTRRDAGERDQPALSGPGSAHYRPQISGPGAVMVDHERTDDR